jgi:hypothetical protein
MTIRILSKFRILAIASAFVLLAASPLAYSSRVEFNSTDIAFRAYISSAVQLASELREQSSSLGTQTSTGLGTNVQVTFDPNFLPQNEPSIAQNPSNSQNLVAGANDYRLVASGHQAWAGVYTSFNGGVSWSNQLIPGFPGSGTTNILSAFSVASDPSLAFDRSGNLYYSGIAFKFQGFTAVDGSVFVSKSTDSGTSFSQTVLVATGSTKIFNDKSYLTVDKSVGTFGGRVYVSWTRFTTTGDIMVSHSSDGGASFSAPVKISVSNLNQGSVPIVGPSGELYVVWDDIIDHFIMEAKSTNGGVSFSSPVVVSTYIPLPSPLPNSKFRTNDFPTAAVDDTIGNVYVAWADYRNGNGDILFSRSTNGGSAWSSPIKVNDDNTANDQFFPWMTVSSGRVGIDFYDRRLDPNNHLMDVFYSQSTDAALSFSPNVRVTDVSSNPDAVLFGSGQSFIGDYIGIISNATVVHPVWTDLRNVSPSTPADQDIFTDSLSSHDLALGALFPARNVMYQSVSVKPLNLTAVVQNLGVSTETSLTVSFFANGTLVGSTSIASLPGRSSTMSVFGWNTNALAKGKYLLSAKVSPVAGETNLSNDALATGNIAVRFPGDIDGDKIVDFNDITVLLFSYGSSPGSPTWNPLTDIDNSGVVDFNDVTISLANYLKVDP